MKQAKDYLYLLIIFLILLLGCLIEGCKTVDISGEREIANVRNRGKVQIVRLKGLHREFIFPGKNLKSHDLVKLKKNQ